MNEVWDAVMIGAGPAGGVASWVLASAGWKILLVDKASFPRHKVCGGCLSSQAVLSLKSNGLNDWLQRLPQNQLREFHFRMPGKKISLPLPGGMAISRSLFDSSLAEAAQKAGACFQPETTGKLGRSEKDFREVILTSRGETRPVRAKIVLICAGLENSALSCAGGKTRISKDSRLGINAVIDYREEDYREGAIYMGCSPKGYVGLVRLEEGRLNIAAAVDFPPKNRAVNFGAEISEILRASGFTVPVQMKEAEWRGTPPLTRSLEKVAGERYFVLGDAAGYSEPFTGEGMTWAIDSAFFLGRLLRSFKDWNPKDAAVWMSWHKKNIQKRQTLSRLLTRGLRHTPLLRPAVSLLQWKPEWARSFVPSLCGTAQ